ncbi:S-adenosyl-L-methionine-dependent methyltransferase [Collybia nuda]|uniref:S-adenosyl-L-methionine-dependent methyltransferase n=1 Tax=Collybia nuda TaxID=64659 RepID=A0A9P5YCB2_9AGAR|nr:S-adenosyl-L-methionine-dependent methyltransferase [Collybia nuda]
MSNQLLDTPAKHPFSVSALVDKTWNHTVEAVFRTGWTPITRLAEAAVVALMEKITHGQLRVLTYSHIYTFPIVPSNGAGDDFKAELRVVNETFWVRLCAMSDLGFAEAYMYGDVECDDLVSLFHIFLDNRENLSSLNSKLSYFFTLPQKITSYRFLNTIGNSRSNISAHYDISNAMFTGFLSEDMTYSCGIFEELDGDLIQGHMLRKLRHIIKKAQILPGHRVLEIGSGWGSMAILIAQTVPNATIDTITLSVQQQTLARERIIIAGLESRITVHLMDYRDMPPEWEHAFDRVVSVEMIEAVGAEYLETYWKVVDRAMKLRGGVGVVQVISIPEALFPGGFLPTLTLLLQTMQAGSSGRLVVDSVSNIGPHYARTLREWRKRFLDRFDAVIVPALKNEYPTVMCGPRGEEEIEVFKRKWICVCYCEVGFTTRTLGGRYSFSVFFCKKLIVRWGL